MEKNTNGEKEKLFLGRWWEVRCSGIYQNPKHVMLKFFL